MNAPLAPPPPISAASVRSNIAVDILLSLATCGIYNLFWQARQFRALNAFLGEERFGFWKWFLLSLVTCGVWHVYTEYVMGQAIHEIQARMGRRPTENLPVLCLALSIFGLTLVADAIQQEEINKWF